MRRKWILIHRVSGLLLAGFLVIVGATGALLAWRAQLERLFAPKLFVLPKHERNEPRANPLYVRRQLESAYPWARVDMVDLSSGEDVPLEFTLTPRSVQTAAHDLDDDAFADPFSGKILGARRYGDLRQGRVNTIPFIYNLHQQLALGGFGATCLGFIALLWTLDCFVGMYLSFPVSRRALGLSSMARITSWPSRFAPSLLVRRRTNGFRRLYESHRAAGVWLWLLLLVFAWSGTAFNLPWFYRAVMHPFGGSAEVSSPSPDCPDPAFVPGENDWARILAFARSSMGVEAGRRHFQILAERFLSYEPSSCEWMYRVRSTRDVDSVGNTQLIFRPGNGNTPKFSAPTGETNADTFTTWIEAIHEAQVGGTAVRLLVFTGGVVTVFLAITGVLIFVRKIWG